MTCEQLDQIEVALGFPLPREYRAMSQAFPFAPLGNDWVYWFLDDPARVIAETKAPLVDGDYSMSNWQPSYLAIGYSACGDVYFLDAARADSPVFCLSHEDHSITEDWPSLAAFGTEWQTAVANHESWQRQERAASRAWWRWCSGIILVSILIPLVLLLWDFLVSILHGFLLILWNTLVKS